MSNKHRTNTKWNQKKKTLTYPPKSRLEGQKHKMKKAVNGKFLNGREDI